MWDIRLVDAKSLLKGNIKDDMITWREQSIGHCGKYGLQRAVHWYHHAPKGVMESDEIKALRDFMIQCDHHIECRKSDIVAAAKEEKMLE